MTTFVIPGPPVPKARARTVVKGGRTLSYTPAATRAYERSVRLLAKACGVRRTERPVVIRVYCYLADARRRDLDNLVKAITDGLNGVAYADDSQIVELHATKSVDRTHPRAVVTVEEVADA